MSALPLTTKMLARILHKCFPTVFTVLLAGTCKLEMGWKLPLETRLCSSKMQSAAERLAALIVKINLACNIDSDLVTKLNDMKHVGKMSVSSYFRPEEGFVFTKSLISLSVDLTNNIPSPCQPVPFCKIVMFWTFEIFSVRVNAALGSWGIASGRKGD